MPAQEFTKKANTPKRKRQWQHIYDNMKERGFGAGRSIKAANSVLKKHPARTRSQQGLG